MRGIFLVLLSVLVCKCTCWCVHCGILGSSLTEAHGLRIVWQSCLTNHVEGGGGGAYLQTWHVCLQFTIINGPKTPWLSMAGLPAPQIFVRVHLLNLVY